jgi:hypothetical protein
MHLLFAAFAITPGLASPEVEVVWVPVYFKRKFVMKYLNVSVVTELNVIEVVTKH